MIDFVGMRKWFYIVSLLIILPGIVSLAIPPGLKLAVDFTGGTLWELQFQQPVVPGQIREVFAQHGHPDAIVQTTGENTVIVRSKEIPGDSPLKQEIEQAIRERLGQFTELRFESVGPIVGQEVAQRAVLAVALASLGILAYISYAFRGTKFAARFGVCAVIALVHDAVLLLGIFSIFGRVFGIEIDALFVTAVLTVIGFSVHDTIVVFDRVRENLGRYGGQPFPAVVNYSLAQTLGRSLLTSITTLLTLGALVLFGGVTTRWFALALFIGILSGTYSSIFNASALLVSWEQGELGRLFGRRRATSPT